ncbi:MAG: response regulator transcription factor [Coprococcus sp.]
MTDILIIEDNKELGTLICDFLRRDGFSVEWKENAEEGLECVEKAAYKMLLLDVMLPGMDGYEALQTIRRKHNIPVLMMSAKTDDQSKILGLDVGADDYLDKPFSFPVLSSKVKAILRRNYEMTEEKKLLVYQNIMVDVAARTVTKNGKEISVTGKEYDILCYFMEHPEQVIHKETLFNAVWGCDCFSEMNTLNVYVRWLREKLEDDPKNPTLIQTVWKVGYRFGGVCSK